MANLRRLLVVLVLASAGLALANAASAGANACNGQPSNCITGWTFDLDNEGWAANDAYRGTVRWQASLTAGTPAGGVVDIEPDGIAEAYTTVSLPAGRYYLVYRVGSNDWWPLRNIQVSIQTDATTLQVSSNNAGNWTQYTSSTFELTNDADVQILVDGVHWYLDALWVMRDSTPTATPAAGTPTATTAPATATPRATSTPYCQTLTPTPQFASPYATPLPSYLSWSVYNRFNTPNTFDDTMGAGSVWNASSNLVRIVANSGRTTSEAGSVFVPFSADAPLDNPLTLDRPALFYIPLVAITSTSYIDVWGRASSVYSGQSAYLEVWRRDGASSEWSRVVSASVPAGSFSPLHTAIVSNTTGLAFAASRTDNGTGGVYVDDIYMYASLSRAPECGGWYVLGTPVPDGTMPDGGPDCGPGDMLCAEWYWDWGPFYPPETIQWPENKACPDPINMPNNFWGYLLKNVHMFLLNVFAYFPEHVYIDMAGKTRGVIGSPIGTFVAIFAVFFDGRVPILITILILSGEITRGILALWMILKNASPFMK